MLADQIARKGKNMQPGVVKHLENQDANLLELQKNLLEKTYNTSTYTTFIIHEPKERIIFRLPYYPDRITHHAVMNILEPIFVSMFTSDTYSCIKTKGIHSASRAVQKALKDKDGSVFCLKMDITKFYPNVDHSILKGLLHRKFKDPDLLWLLENIIDSAEGLPIGNYLSQYLANFYLSYFDHWVKEEKRISYYFRYADDMVILSGNKQDLHVLLAEIREYLSTKLKLTIKDNYQIFPVEKRGIDFVGYRFYHTHTLLRKNIKKNFARMLRFRRNYASIASYMGWAKHCNSKNLIKKLLHE